MRVGGSRNLAGLCVGLVVAASGQMISQEPVVAGPALESSDDPAADGRIAFTMRTGEGYDIFTVNPDGSSRIRLTRSGDAGSPDWSPDGTRIAYASEDDLWVMGARGDDPVRLTSGTAVDSDPSWSPDGGRLAFTRKAGKSSAQIHVLTLDTGTITQVTQPSQDWAAAGDPAWSPTDDRIAFTRRTALGPDDYESSTALFLVDAGGDNPAAVPDTWGAESPSWAPDGSRLLFAEGYDDEYCSYDVFSMLPDGTDKRELLAEDCYDLQPVWSPSGARVALYSTGPSSRPTNSWDAGFEHAGLWTVGADGTHRYLVARAGSEPDWQTAPSATPRPAWEPDSRAKGRVVYTSVTDEGLDIFSAQGDGSDLRRLTTNGRSGSPAASPDGSWILYQDLTPTRPGLWLMRWDGSGKRRLRALDGTGAGDPSWAPGGNKFVFVSTNNDSVRWIGLYVYELGAAKPRRIAMKPDAGTNVSDPDWSPDGRWIVYVATRVGDDRRQDLFRIRPGGTTSTRVTRTPGLESQPAWGPGGRRIAFTYTLLDEGVWKSGVFTADLDGEQRRRLLSTPALEYSPTWAPGGRRVAVYSDGPRPFGRRPAPGIWTLRRDGTDRRLVTVDRTAYDLDWSVRP